MLYHWAKSNLGLLLVFLLLSIILETKKFLLSHFLIKIYFLPLNSNISSVKMPVLHSSKFTTPFRHGFKIPHPLTTVKCPWGGGEGNVDASNWSAQHINITQGYQSQHASFSISLLSSDKLFWHNFRYNVGQSIKHDARIMTKVIEYIWVRLPFKYFYNGVFGFIFSILVSNAISCTFL